MSPCRLLASFMFLKTGDSGIPGEHMSNSQFLSAFLPAFCHNSHQRIIWTCGWDRLHCPRAYDASSRPVEPTTLPSPPARICPPLRPPLAPFHPTSLIATTCETSLAISPPLCRPWSPRHAPLDQHPACSDLALALLSPASLHRLLRVLLYASQLPRTSRSYRNGAFVNVRPCLTCS